MELVKLDEYEYDIVDVMDDQDEYLYTVLSMTFDDAIDPLMYDVVSELMNCRGVYVDGRVFKWTDYTLQEEYKTAETIKLMLYLVEDKRKEGVV